MILNHIIVITNLFGVDAGTTLLFFKIEREFWPQLKSFLLFLNMLRETDMYDIKEDENIKKLLEKL